MTTAPGKDQPAQLGGDGAPKFIAVDGPIGVGKSTLARRIAERLGYPVLLEPSEQNPFLKHFYRKGRSHALPTQLFFLLGRMNQVADLPSHDLLGPTVVMDFILEKDRLFAEITLDKDEMVLYEQISDSIQADVPKPDLVIYLQAPVPVLLERIRRRGIAYEQTINSEYLTMLSDSYTRFFHHYDDSPLLIVNVAEIDLAHNDAHLDVLLREIDNMSGARHYFNPNPKLI